MLGGAEEQELSFQFENLQISIRVTVRPLTTASVSRASGSGVEVAAEADRGLAVEAEFIDPYHITFDLEERALAALTAPDLSALPLPFLRHLEPRLRGSDSEWTSRARLARAFRAGCAAYRRLNGEFSEVSSPGIPFRNTIYIILCCPRYPAGVWTSDYTAFIEACGRSHDSDFHRNTVCQAFATRTEGDAFLCGARRQWPSQLQQ